MALQFNLAKCILGISAGAVVSISTRKGLPDDYSSVGSEWGGNLSITAQI